MLAALGDGSYTEPTDKTLTVAAFLRGHWLPVARTGATRHNTPRRATTIAQYEITVETDRAHRATTYRADRLRDARRIPEDRPGRGLRRPNRPVSAGRKAGGRCPLSRNTSHRTVGTTGFEPATP
ncbi:hypothetical protein PA7_41100 [Pseudonocardia asaccharolytica DSM 44247 = NBRC 16224]|uniref:Uncharacterized protein n=1 Tax=Pseudonocardia asaccharolytica DSM 44247 = NBRC 16224 TaxID=1123024 RepID=A0A511D747_9PSEU|nr:hypothetical protein PA7_41100 [Pseudonocardia asaccharolytica DSM 44247 = NBRC 16224]